MADLARTAINPSDQESVPSALAKFMRDFMLNVDDCLPAIVVSYDRKENEAIVRPIVSRLTVADQAVERQEVVSVQVFSFGGGGFNINFPLSPGDLGWIKATDRDLANFRATLAEAPPPNSITHSFSSSMFYPDVMRKFTVQGEHGEEAVFQSTDGVNRVAVGSGRVKIAAAGTYIEVTNGKITVVADELDAQVAETKFSGNVTIAGRTTMNGGFDATGGGNSNVDKLSVDGTPVEGHDHGGVQHGSDNTDPFGA